MYSVPQCTRPLSRSFFMDGCVHNYVHIQLCATLGVAQIIFVAGTEAHFGRAFGGWSPSWLSIGGCSPLLVTSLLHVGTDGGCGPLRCVGQDIC